MIPRRSRIKRTSKEAFNKIEAGGELSSMRFAAYKIVRYFGPVTGAEVDAISAKTVKRRGHLHKRLSELELLGLVAVVATRTCRVTGHSAEAWDITDLVPSSYNLPKKATRAELVHLLRLCVPLLPGDETAPMVLKKDIKQVLKNER